MDISPKDVSCIFFFFLKQKKTNVFIGTCDGKLYNWNPSNGDLENFGKHESGVKCVKWLPNQSSLLTGSWDKTCKIWDVKQGKSVQEIDAKGKVFCLDSKGDKLVIGNSNQQIVIHDLRYLKDPIIEMSQLRLQTRCISIFTDLEGYVIGSIEGRCSVQYFADYTKNFCFKCHRIGDDIYPVNAIDFSPVYNTFATVAAGGLKKKNF